MKKSLIKNKSSGLTKKHNSFLALNCDRVFKTVLLDNDDYTFLNRLLSDILNEDVKVKDVKYTETPITNVKVRVKLLDVLVSTENSGYINIEANNTFNKVVQERNLFYYMNLFSQRLKRGKIKDENIRQINLNFKTSLKKEMKEEVMITEVKSKNIYNEEFKSINVNIALCKKLWYDEIVKGHSRALKHIELVLLGCKSKKELKEISEKGDEVVKGVAKRIMKLNNDVEFTLLMTPEEESEVLSERSLYYAEQEGLKKGKAEEKNTIAKALIKEQMPIEKIANIINLSPSEVSKIQETMMC